MKKKILLTAILLIGLAVCAYLYVYQGHRDVTASSTDFTITVANLQKEFSDNDSLATQKYQDKIVQISGVVTAVEPENKSIAIDGKMVAAFDTAVPKEIAAQKKVIVKGRFLGYDDLLEEFKMDQSSLVVE